MPCPYKATISNRTGVLRKCDSKEKWGVYRATRCFLCMVIYNEEHKESSDAMKSIKVRDGKPLCRARLGCQEEAALPALVC